MEDLKNLGKILGTHINKYLNLLVHRDQMGFILGRQACDNLPKVVHLFHLLNHCKNPDFLLSLDISKALESLLWEYLNFVLSCRGFGEAFLTWFMALYSVPSAFVKYAGYFSVPFLIHKDTRQGYPISSAHFILDLKPFVLTLNQDQNITGVPYVDRDYKLSLFVDDALLTLTNPLIAIPNLQKILSCFSAISCLCIHLIKMIALITLSPDLVVRLQFHFPFSMGILLHRISG